MRMEEMKRRGKIMRKWEQPHKRNFWNMTSDLKAQMKDLHNPP